MAMLVGSSRQDYLGQSGLMPVRSVMVIFVGSRQQDYLPLVVGSAGQLGDGDVSWQ